MPGRVKTDVIVIGAGAAGLAAARELSQQGIKVLVLEARERLGGRIHTIHDHGSPLPVELGAEFIHGEPGETFSIVRAASLPVDELPDNRYWSRTGRLYTIPDFWERIERTRKALLRYLKRFPRRDAPLSDFLASPGLRADDRSLFQNFAEGYHAAYPEKVSARWVAGDPDEESGSDTRQFRLLNGYSSLIQVLRGSLDPVRVAVRLNTIVSRIEWSRGNVTVHCRSGLGATLGPFKARAALVTIPAAVLRAGIPDFHPQLAEKDRALRHIEGGQIFKMILRFRSAFWDDETFLQERMGKADSSAAAPINFILAPQTPVSTWWTTHPSRSPLITAWAGGPRADLLLNQDPDGRVSNTLEALASALAVPRARLDDLFEHALLHDWRADPYSREAYSYVGVGGVRAQQTLAQPVEGTLFFAGEATDAEQTGTVAGALASGDRAARQLRDALEG